MSTSLQDQVARAIAFNRLADARTYLKFKHHFGLMTASHHRAAKAVIEQAMEDVSMMDPIYAERIRRIRNSQ